MKFSPIWIRKKSEPITESLSCGLNQSLEDVLSLDFPLTLLGSKVVSQYIVRNITLQVFGINTFGLALALECAMSAWHLLWNDWLISTYCHSFILHS